MGWLLADIHLFSRLSYEALLSDGRADIDSTRRL